MKKVKLLAALGLCGFVLGACNTNETSSESLEDVGKNEAVESEATPSEEPGIDELNQSITDEINKMGTEEEIDWEKINLNKRQYKEYIESLDDEQNKTSENSEETLTVVSSSMTDDNTIEIVINNTDTSVMNELANDFFALMMDSFSRQLYLHSDFSDGTTQPTIIIKDDTGNLISEATDFIDTEATE